MKKQFDIFLLSLLWMIASVLGASFWFSTRFGFDIFSIQHWNYLANLQAARTGIDSDFYLSVVLTAIVTIGGLYLIAQPRRRKINMQQPVEKKYTPPSNVSAPVTPTNTPGVMIPPRPPRLILPNINEYNRPAAPKPTDMPPPSDVMPLPELVKPLPTVTPDNNFQEIEKIFENAGFSIKKPPRIAGIRPALFAIGMNETLWVGAVGIESAKLSNVIATLGDIFTETLEDIKINIRAFLLNPLAGDSGDAAILKFDTLDDLRAYMNDNQSPQVPDSEKEDFDAYSEYIDTVSDYFNKP